MSTIKLSKEEAFLAMYSFLESYYSLTKADDIGALLGDLSLLPDGGCSDPAVQIDWDDAVQKAISGNVNVQLKIKNT